MQGKMEMGKMQCEIRAVQPNAKDRRKNNEFLSFSLPLSNVKHGFLSENDVKVFTDSSEVSIPK